MADVAACASAALAGSTAAGAAVRPLLEVALLRDTLPVLTFCSPVVPVVAGLAVVTVLLALLPVEVVLLEGVVAVVLLEGVVAVVLLLAVEPLVEAFPVFTCLLAVLPLAAEVLPVVLLPVLVLVVPLEVVVLPLERRTWLEEEVLGVVAALEEEFVFVV